MCSGTLWVSLMNSPMRLGASPAASAPTGVFIQRFEAFISLSWNPGLCGSLSPQLFLPVFLHANVGPPGQPPTALLGVLSTRLPVISTPPAGLDECFFFNSLVVRLPYSLIFCQFWLFFVFKFVVVLLLVVRGSKVYLPMPPPCLEVSAKIFLKTCICDFSVYEVSIGIFCYYNTLIS